MTVMIFIVTYNLFPSSLQLFKVILSQLKIIGDKKIVHFHKVFVLTLLLTIVIFQTERNPSFVFALLLGLVTFSLEKVNLIDCRRLILIACQETFYFIIDLKRVPN
jgi:hypothetical protein